MPSASKYKTRQRVLVEEILKLSDGKHLTAENIVEALLKKGEKVGRTTVYRCLENLMNEGKVQRFAAVSGESACYQYIGSAQCHDHFHLKCTSCGKLIHIECEHVAELAKHIARHHNFSVDKLRTVLYGVCEDCVNNEKTSCDTAVPDDSAVGLR